MFDYLIKKLSRKGIVSQSYVGLMVLFSVYSTAQLRTNESEIGLGWSSNSVNTVIFRNSALTTVRNWQYASYYNPDGKMVLAKRKLDSNDWQKVITPYSGNVKDAHNSISIAIDSDGYLHVSWDQHDTRLRYAKSKKPFSLELGEEQSMTGNDETKVTYPEFHNLPNGKLLFCYRSGASGRGNMIMKLYNVKTQKWTSLQHNLIDGENQRSAYWQICVDKKGIYMSWVWRESWDVSTNNDICYAFSADGGQTWQKSTGEKYRLPITKSTAEIAWKVPQKSSLINQTAMTVDTEGNPYIASYWDDSDVPQYKVVYLGKGKWNKIDTDFHNKPFNLGGGGTKKIPISRPEILVSRSMLYLLFRDEERADKITLASANLDKKQWKLADITDYSVGQWEPNLDKQLWKDKGELHIFSQNVSQADGEGLAEAEPQAVRVIELKKLPKIK
ncbi:BNR repeat-containing protein [Flavobacterium aquicola]|uniref:Putative BNR repeat neuraminidase n=1 Tax=Flavobacterium aquicola TaxID=1682742 RepID=A0A3E0EDI7_9FLAO|nr:BNR repeat-containing protein [Flavobacterium aquicola]REG96317.1 putative BNR repeat neuraminidase [Flavobacterium aquicola]